MGLELDKPGFILALVLACEMSVWGVGSWLMALAV